MPFFFSLKQREFLVLLGRLAPGRCSDKLVQQLLEALRLAKEPIRVGHSNSKGHGQNHHKLDARPTTPSRSSASHQGISRSAKKKLACFFLLGVSRQQVYEVGCVYIWCIRRRVDDFSNDGGTRVTVLGAASVSVATAKSGNHLKGKSLFLCHRCLTYPISCSYCMPS